MPVLLPRRSVPARGFRLVTGQYISSGASQLSNILLQLFARAVQRYRDHQRRHSVHFRYLRVGVALDETESEHLGGTAIEPGDGEAKHFAKVALLAGTD